MKNLLKRIKIIKAMIKVLQKLLLLVKKEKGFKEFALAIRQRESSNRYDIVNAYGYLGAYQFGMARLSDLGYTIRIGSGYNNDAFDWKQGYSKKGFLNNPDFQDKIFKQHCDNLVQRIEANFPEYLGTTISGTKITLSGLVAGAHIGGIGGVSAFLKHSINNQDQLGTSVFDYIKKFGGYNLKVV